MSHISCIMLSMVFSVLFVPKIACFMPHGTAMTRGRPSALFSGQVALVGAGPGDPELLTVQALKLIQNATLVVADRLVSQEILDLVTCELKIAKKRPGCAEEAQREINGWVIDAVKSGGRVVRLKIGDPFLFGRAGEEVLEFRKCGVEPIIATGISSSYSAPLAANIPLTHRGVSNQVTICTGYGREASAVPLPEYRENSTLVFLMAVGRISAIASELIASGYPVDTPVGIVEKATTPAQRTIRGTLRDIGELARKHKTQAPSTIVVGEVVDVLESRSEVEEGYIRV